jgi:superkiller protein 3
VQLPKLYEEVISHPNTTDDLRRETEAKLLRHRIRFLHSLSASKDGERRKAASDVVDALVEGVVLLNIPDDLAWSMAIDGKNAESIGDAAPKQYLFYPIDVRYRAI